MKKISLLATVFLLITFAAKSNTYVVVTTVDAGAGSLRQAILQANANPGMDTIIVNLASSAVISPLSPFTVSDSLLISGNVCQNPTIDGTNDGSTNSLFFVSVSTVPLTINSLNFTNCNINTPTGGQGAVINSNILYLNYCYFYNNGIAGGFGPLSFGGAVSGIDVTAHNCSFFNNSVGLGGPSGGEGGAVAAFGSANFYNCTFYENQATAFASAMYVPTAGNILNCTFAYNSIVGNGGAGGVIFNNGSPNNINIANNIFWGNTSSGSTPCIWFVTPTQSGGCNILQQPSDNSDFTTTATDVFGVDPLLQSFGYYGGCIPVAPIGCGSVAQNHATCPGATAADADDVPASGVRDAGAWELPEYIPHLGPNVVQCGGTVSLQATIPVGIDTYVWSTGETTDNIIASTSGYYHVVVSDIYGCSASDSIQIYIEPRPEVNLGGPYAQCAGTVMLNAGNVGDNYSWNTTATSQTITVGSTGTYSVTVTDPNSNCSASATTNVTIHSLPVVNLGGPYEQCGGSVTLNAQHAGSTFYWSDGTSGQTLAADASGFYSVTVTDGNGCTGMGGATVTIDPVPFVYLPADTTACGSSMILNAGSGPGYTYQWQDNNNTQTENATVNGTYSVTVTNSYNCTASAQSNVTLLSAPVINLGPNINQCGGTAVVNAGNNGDTYLWSDGSTNQQLQATTSGTYIVTVTDPSTCSATGSIQIYIQAQPFVDLGADTTQCGGVISLDAGNPGNLYFWSDNETTQTILVSSTGNYSVTVIDPNGGCSASGSINVTIFQVPVVNLGPDTTQCGGSVTLYAGNAGSTFVWGDGSTADSIVATTPGQYSVTVTNGSNCSAAGSINVYIQTVPSVYIGEDVRQCGGSVTLDAGNPGYGYAWSDADTTQTTVVSTTNTYSVTVTNLVNHCSSADTINVIIDTIPVVNLGPDTTQCGGTITLDAGNAGSTYLWSDNSSSETLVVSASGIYRVSVTNGNGCSATGSITVTINPIPVVTLSLPTNVCITVPPFLLSGGSPLGGTYFEADTAIALFNPNWQGIGSHQITYVYTNIYSCTDSASGSIFVRPQPSVTIVDLPYLCTTSSEVNLNNYFTPGGGMYTGVGVSGSFFYPNLVPPGNDTIVDMYTDSFGCMDTSDLAVVIHAPVHVNMTSSVADFTICQTQSITFTATGAENYQFFVNDTPQSGPSSTNTFTTTTLSNHSMIYVVGSNPCSTDTSEPMVIDVITPPVVNAGRDTTINLGQTVQLQGIATGIGNLTFLWTPGTGLNFINVPNPTFSGTDSITFWLKATDSYGCVDSASVSIGVIVPDNVLLPNVITPNGDGFNDIWKLNSKINLDGSHLVIFDRWGMIVYETDNYANNWGGTYKSTGQVLPDDTYYYVLKVPAQDNHVYEGPINIISGSTK